MHPRLSGRYAKSLIDLAVERDQLEVVQKDMLFLQRIIKSNRDFVNLLKSPIVKADKKEQIIGAIVTGRISELTALFIKLVISKGREMDLPEIVNAFLNMYNRIRGIHKVKLVTAAPVSDDVKQTFVRKIKEETAFPQVELETVVKDDIIGGFILEFDNKMVDASISRDLKDISKQFRQNIYVQQIR